MIKDRKLRESGAKWSSANQDSIDRQENGLLPMASSEDERDQLLISFKRASPSRDNSHVESPQITTTLLPKNDPNEPSQPSTDQLETQMSTLPTSTTHEETTTSTTKKPLNCPDESYCLNGGTCILNESNQMVCICPEGFYGSRCQTRNICKTIILGNLTGDQICSKIQRDCWKNDKFLRCNCKEDEYFVFKTNSQPTNDPNGRIFRSGARNFKSQSSSELKQSEESLNNHVHTSSSESDLKQPRLSREENILADRFTNQLTNETLSNAQTLLSDSISSQDNNLSYIAECRKIDKCLGVRCRQLSEQCEEGECVCNQNLGYMRDHVDNLCKLLDPCKVPTEDGKPICGQAQCVATYDKELYKCICPIGYQALRVGSHRSSTVCTILRNLICRVPLLNKCQHICEVDNANNNYKCSCLRGYRPGARPGVDDHMCFFIDHVDEQLNFDLDYNDVNQQGDQYGRRSPDDVNEYVYRPYPITKPNRGRPTQSNPRTLSDTFTYDPIISTSNPFETTPSVVEHLSESLSMEDFEAEDVPTRLKSGEIYIKRERRSNINKNLREDWWGKMNPSGDSRRNLSAHHNDIGGSSRSAQERCNMYCDENKICELEADSTESYRCVCNRQGYVSVGDRCLDWCAAAEFEWQLRGLLDYTCWSGVCKSISNHPRLYKDSKLDIVLTKDGLDDEVDIAQLERESSWRPSFECDCSNSPLLSQDPVTKLCKFNFQAAIEPCLPGNVGYVDCVEHKNAYCAVLYKQHKQFISEHQRERYYKNTPTGHSSSSGDRSQPKPRASTKGSNNGESNKQYTCVCSPEKKFLVDKPRKKERCVNECDLLNVECGRFNRMCRSSTMEIEEFGHRNLIHLGPEGPRIDFKRTGCECLPGFNVGPSESIDFTIDDNNPSDGDGQTDGALNSSYIYTSNDPIPINYILDSKANLNGLGESSEQNRAKYININSRCLLDYDVVEFHASFKAPPDFNPNWIKVNNALNIPMKKPNKLQRKNSVKPAKSSIWTCCDKGENNTCPDNEKPDEETPSTDVTEPRPILEIPDFMRIDINELHKHIVLVGLCDPTLMPISIEAYIECIKYRYWIVEKLRSHYIDWRRVITNHLKETFDLMDGNIRLRVNKCDATLKSVTKPPPPELKLDHPGSFEIAGESSTPIRDSDKNKKKNTKNENKSQNSTSKEPVMVQLDPHDQQVIVEANINCELTLHSASDDSLPRYARKVLLEKQLQKFIFPKSGIDKIGKDYYLMAPNMLIERESFDQLAKHRKEFNPCKSEYEYCDKQTRCEMVDTVNFTCTCEYGYTPIGSRDIYLQDSRKEVCEDINECLFDVCKELANVSTCINEIGDYRCQCNRHFIGDNKRYCKHVCETITCKHGKCRLVDDHHAFCECDEGYKETDCSVQDPNVALRKANMIICGSIFTSVLLLLITFCISLNSQLKKTKRKLKQIEAANETGRLFEFSNQQPFRPRLSKVSISNA